LDAQVSRGAERLGTASEVSDYQLRFSESLKKEAKDLLILTRLPKSGRKTSSRPCWLSDCQVGRSEISLRNDLRQEVAGPAGCLQSVACSKQRVEVVAFKITKARLMKV
jgi:hypothetical protein